MTDKHNTLVTFLLDRSHSMGIIRQSTIDSFNAYLASLKEEKGDGFNCEFTFLQFDSISLDKHYIAEPVKNVKPLDTSSFVPRGSTPLIDSCVKTIKAVADSLEKRDDKPKVVVCFQTDGEENMSTEHSWADLNKLIKEKTLAGWEFIFMGAGIDAYEQGQKMGIASVNTVSYDSSDRRKTMASFTASASNARGFGTGAMQNASYTMQQKVEAGDRFDKTLNGGILGQPGNGALNGTAPDIDLTKKADQVGKAIRSKSLVDDFDLNAKS